jgi:hypothetical protein
MFSEHRDVAAAKAFFRSAKTVTGVTPDRVTPIVTTAILGRFEGCWARRCSTEPATTSITDWSETIGT